MGVSIQQWRSAIGCFSSNSFKSVTKTDQSASSANMPRPNLFIIVIFTILTISLYGYCILDNYNSRFSDSSQLYTSESLPIPSSAILNLLPPWPPDSHLKVCQSLRFASTLSVQYPTYCPQATPAPLLLAYQLPWKVPWLQSTPFYSEPWPACQSSTSPGTAPWSTSTTSAWFGTCSSSPPPVWAPSSPTGKTSPEASGIKSESVPSKLPTRIQYKKDSNFLARYTNGNRRHSGLKICHWNAGSSHLVNKHNEIETVIASHKPHIIGISETSFHGLHSREDIQVEDYEVYFAKTLQNPDLDVSRISVFVHNDVQSMLRPDLMSDKFSSIWLELGHKNQKKILVCNL